jgi:inner membrane protein
MTTPNHIAGGIVFTGTMLSFYNENIFEKPLYLVLCVLFSILPDCDTPKTLPGKLIHPLAVAINRRFGHRTITHSLTFLFFTVLILFVFHFFFHIEGIYFRIIIFSIISHYILDMLTIQGVPLLYPFKRNQCVLPANPKYRLTTGEIKTETILFTVLILVGFTMLPLFSQGFWSSYNRQFATISHCHSENINSNNWVVCEYEYNENNKTIKDKGYIVESSPSQISVFNGHHVVVLSQSATDKKINKTLPTKTGTPKQSEDIFFVEITLDSLISVTKNRLFSGHIQATKDIIYVENGIKKKTIILKLDYVINPNITAYADTAVQNKLNKIKMLDIKLNLINKDIAAKKDQINGYRNRIQEIKEMLPGTKSLYEKNKLQNELIATQKKITSDSIKNNEQAVFLLLERDFLINSMKDKDKILFSGFLKFFKFS